MSADKVFHDEKYRQFKRDAISGAKAGFCAGTFVAPFEFLKVTIQAQGVSLIKAIGSRAVLENMLKSIPVFSLIFGLVCSIEFSINDRIRFYYGASAGLLASGFTGAVFLTAADHLMFRQHKKQNFFQSLSQLAGRPLFTGLTPMILRESIFVANVAYLGPATGQLLKNWFGDTQSDIAHDFRGRIVSGLITTLVSQPFDVLARNLQIRRLNGQALKLVDCLKDMQNIYTTQNLKIWQHPLLRGAVPRLFLAASGGAIAGGLYDHFKDQN